YLAESGYNVTGVDSVESMVDQAINRQYTGNRKPEYFTGDLRHPAPVKNQDLVVCIYDSINYLINEIDVGKFLSSVLQIISKKGLLIFDCSTEQNSLSHFNGYEAVDSIEDALLFRRAYYDRKSRIQNNLFEIYPEEDNNMYFEHHIQRIWSIQKIKELIKNNGFQLMAVYGGFTFHRGSESDDRVQFIAKPL
ncbi:MAG: methyltransferase domain-containing protein, partial [Candidatus Electryonea clarkiae]|nr:methyltransferase domain-containing protein [Candidatus Electryonea clarkiae]